MQSGGGNFFLFEEQANHNQWLDLLRTLAIFLVLLRHASGIENNGLSSGFIANIFVNGWVGVDLFFVLAGYLIAGGLIRRSSLSGGFFPVGYFKDRILRIVPAYYAVLALCVLGFFPGFAIRSEDVPQSFLEHLLFLQDYTGSDINVVFWTLGVEEKFYIVAPLLVWFLFKPKSLRVCAAMGLAVLLVSPISRGMTFETLGQGIEYNDFFVLMRSPFHMSLEGFVIGIMVAILQARGFSLPKSAALIGLCVSGAMLAFWLGSHEFYFEITRFDAWAQPTLLAFLFGFMVFCAASLSEQKMQSAPFFRVNARLSYTLYLVHYPLLPLAFAIAYQQHYLVFWASYLALSYAMAMLVHFGIEKPFLVLKKRLNEKVAIAPSKPAGAVLS